MTAPLYLDLWFLYSGYTAVVKGCCRVSTAWLRSSSLSYSAAWPLITHFGPEDVLLALDDGFAPEASADTVQVAVNHIERAIRTRFPEIKRIHIETRMSAMHLQASRSMPAPLKPIRNSQNGSDFLVCVIAGIQAVVDVLFGRYSTRRCV